MGKFTVLILSVIVFFAFVLGVSAQHEGETFSAELESCLRSVFGDDRYEAFASGQAELTAEEARKVDQCYDSVWVSDRTVFPSDLAQRYPDMFGPGQASPSC